MEEKKSIKVSLGTVVCICIIFVLIIIIGGMYFYYNTINNSSQEVKNNNDNSMISKNENNTDIQASKENIVIYAGGEIKGSRILSPFIDEDNLAKYDTEYNVYANGTKIGKYKGKAELNDFLEYYINLEYDNYDIAISGDYNAIPRQYVETDNVPNKIKQHLPHIIDDTKMETIDLDGDGKEENLVWCKYLIGNEIFTEVWLFDEKYI